MDVNECGPEVCDERDEEVIALKMLDLFAGTGVGVAAHQLGITEYGVEIMPAAVATRDAVGFETPYNDVWDIDQADELDFSILWASPPCQTFSMAGKGAGRKALDDVLSGITSERWRNIDSLRRLGEEVGDDRTALVLTPLTYIERFRPTYVALEQVPTVLPVWEAYATPLEQMGYSVWTGYLHSEQYGMIATCPMHETSPAPQNAGGLSFDHQKLAIADPAGTVLEEWLESAPIAERRSAFIIARAGVIRAKTGRDIGSKMTEAVKSAYDAALIARVAIESARDATWRTLVQRLLSRALSETQTLPGRAGGLSMSEATSGFGSMGLTSGSIESLSRRLWVALCDLAKWYTTLTEAQTITFLKTLPSLPTMDSTEVTMLSGDGRALCGVCDDHAVPQTRKRAYLIARRDGVEAQPPTPTHSKYYPRNPGKFDPGVKKWVSMAEALGWGIKDQPSPTLTSHLGVTRSPSGTQAVYLDAIDRGAFEFKPIEPIPTRVATNGIGAKFAPNTVNIDSDEGAALQSYPVPFPFQGNKSQVSLQIGNAVPPLVAKAVLETFL